MKKPTFSKLGDIWTLGKHKVICGDSTDPATFEKLLGETKANLVCTDAPYFVELKNKSGTIANDNLNDKQGYEFLLKVFTNFKNAMALDASIYEFYATMKTRVFYDAFEDAGFKVTSSFQYDDSVEIGSLIWSQLYGAGEKTANISGMEIRNRQPSLNSME